MKYVFTGILGMLLCLTCATACNTMPSKNNDGLPALNESGSWESITEQMPEDVEDAEIEIGNFLEQIDALQCSYTESSGLSIDHKQEFSLASTEYQDERAEANVTVEVLGKVHNLEYQGSESGPNYRDTVHKYEGDSVEQWVNAETGKIVYFKMPITQVGNQDDACTHEEQFEIAKEFLAKQVDDPENYQVTRNKRVDPGILYVYFNRTISGIITSDNVRVSVDQTGNIRLYRMDHVGEMRGVQPIPEAVLQRVYENLDRKAKGLYGRLEEQGYTWVNENSIEGLSRLDNGSLVLKCYVSTTITAVDGTIFSDDAWFIVPITEPTVQSE